MEALRQCAICSGGITRANWTRSLNTVLLKNNRIDIGILHFDENTLLQESRSLDQQTQIRLLPSLYSTPAEVFLIHQSCRRLLCEFAGFEVSPLQTFKLCQAIQPNRDRNFGLDAELNLSNCCPDPSTFLRPRRYLSQSEDTIRLLQPDIAKCGSFPLQSLPPENMLMILEYLSPSDLIRFFRTNKRALFYANIFCRLNSLYFYRCGINITDVEIENDVRILMIALSTWHHFSELDVRWQIVSKAAELAKLLPFVNESSQVVQTFNPRAPLQTIDHQFGLCEDFLEIPLTVKTIKICSIYLNGKHYACGIGFNTGKSRFFIGHETRRFYIMNIGATIETIGLAMDARGVRSIKYGNSQWLFGDPRSIDCWEGLSIGQENRKIRIIHDALKIRYLSWHQEISPSFEETLLMKNKHPSLSGYGFISEEFYVRQHPEQERKLAVDFGKIPVQAVWFDQGLQTIEIYIGGGFGGISGLSVQTLSGTYRLGTCRTFPMSIKPNPISIKLHTPHEVLTEIDVRTSECEPLALTFRTNYNRELSSKPHELSASRVSHAIKILRPPQGSRMAGLFFRFSETVIDSIGMITSLE